MSFVKNQRRYWNSKKKFIEKSSYLGPRRRQYIIMKKDLGRGLTSNKPPIKSESDKEVHGINHEFIRKWKKRINPISKKTKSDVFFTSEER